MPGQHYLVCWDYEFSSGSKVWTEEAQYSINFAKRKCFV
jgi:hypothetical protein